MKSAGLLCLAVLLGACSPEPAEEPHAGTPAEAAAANAEPPALIARDVIFGNAERSLGRISPDGRHVSWLAPADGIMNVWVAPTATPGQARVVTSDDYRGIRFYQWAPNGEFIYYLQDDGGDENFHVYSANIDTGDVVDLTPVKEGARAQIQAVSALKPDHIVVGLNERDPQRFDLYRIDVTTGERELLLENPGYAAWLIDNELEPRFGVETTPDGGANIVRFDGTTVANIPPEDFLTTNAIGFNKNNDAIFMLDSRGRDKAALTRLSIETGETTVIAEDERADITGVLIDNQTYEPVAYNVDYLKSTWTGLNETLTRDLETIRSSLSDSLTIVAATDDMNRWVVAEDEADAPLRYLVYDRTARSVTPMLVTRPELAEAELAPMHPVVVESRDGLDLVSYLSLPPGSDADGDGRPEQPLPMVLAVHGGPWARDDYGYHPWHQWLANRGYAVLSVNYRGSTGFGKNFVRGAIREFAGKMHDDLIDGVNWAIGENIALPDRIAIAGGSYGGYATLIGVSFTPDTFACGVDIVGPSSLVTLIESFPEYWKPFLAGSWYLYVGDPSNEADHKDMLSRSAISRVNDIRVPLLVGQGENDPRVTKLESDQLVAAMAENGLPVTYVNFPDEGHGFARPENRLAFYAVMEGFLAECLGGRAEPIGEAFDDSTIQVLHGPGYVDGLDEALDARGET